MRTGSKGVCTMTRRKEKPSNNRQVQGGKKNILNRKIHIYRSLYSLGQQHVVDRAQIIGESLCYYQIRFQRTKECNWRSRIHFLFKYVDHNHDQTSLLFVVVEFPACYCRYTWPATSMLSPSTADIMVGIVLWSCSPALNRRRLDTNNRLQNIYLQCCLQLCIYLDVFTRQRTNQSSAISCLLHAGWSDELLGCQRLGKVPDRNPMRNDDRFNPVDVQPDGGGKKKVVSMVLYRPYTTSLYLQAYIITN